MRNETTEGGGVDCTGGVMEGRGGEKTGDGGEEGLRSVGGVVGEVERGDEGDVAEEKAVD
ncbi:unnamed protein product [Trifolium pratense]|uniref:Uncharacterized protein n=1 Tax=Trifolium pratense TaxID=57577 RepID=A0ACB0KHJ6_TRIPR|nr:unnamed protein product [Trifolium pratense]